MGGSYCGYFEEEETKLVDGLVERRRVKKKSRYIIALVLTLAVFVTGLFLGILLTGERTKFLQEDITKQKLDYDSLQMQYLYLISSEDKNCEVINQALEENIKRLENTRKKLEGYLMQSITKESDYIQLKREYMLAEIRYWLLSEETRKVCGRESISLLYFYSNDEDCLDCRAQGTVLTVLKEEFGQKLMIFSVDAGFDEETMIGILKKVYGIEEVPAIVLQETGERYFGLVSKDKLKDELKKAYKRT